MIAGVVATLLSAVEGGDHATRMGKGLRNLLRMRCSGGLGREMDGDSSPPRARFTN